MGRSMVMWRITKKGSIGLEAAIILPLIILGVLSISYLIKINCANESVMSIAVDEARKLNIEAYTPAGRAAAIIFPMNLRERIQENSDCSWVKIKDFRYLYTKEQMDNLISFQVDYKINCSFPILYHEPLLGKETVVTRAFVGSDRDIQRGFSEMEEMEESEIVWIFPLAGEKYHRRDCSYIKVAATKTMLSQNIKRKYKPCSICDSKYLEKGSIVYCFFNNGQSYHRPNCYVVERYVVEIEKSEAVKRGYAPCLKCGGS